MKVLQHNLFNAYYEARKNKRNSYNQLQFEIRYEEKLFNLCKDILNRTYTIGRSTAFIIKEPVKREIFAADFRDRIVHHLLFNYINPIVDPLFIEDSYSCRIGKGTFFGIQRAYENLEMVTENFTRDAYILKLDIRGYFMSIKKEYLMNKLKAMISEEIFNQSRKFQTDGDAQEDLDFDLLFYLLKKVVYHDPKTNFIVKGDLSDWDGLPISKSLFKTPSFCGLPIGNLTSQLFSNIYLNDFDHYVKETLNERYYGRYVDDFYIFHSSKKHLKNILQRCRKYLLKEGLVIHPGKIYLQHYTKGFHFLGVFIKPHRLYMGRRTAKKFKSTVYYYRQLFGSRKLHVDEVKKLRSILNSYLGLLKHYHTYKLRRDMLFKKPACIFYQYGFFSPSLTKITIYKDLLKTALPKNNE